MNHGIVWIVIFFIFILPALVFADEPASIPDNGFDAPAIQWQVDPELQERASALFTLRERSEARPDSLEPPVPEGMEIEFVQLDDFEW
ncbi:hypothetical protein KKA94_03440 [Patescibacteria group bacterium]|nr:hypothetical protein [Patescibacteria group bacterium]